MVIEPLTGAGDIISLEAGDYALLMPAYPLGQLKSRGVSSDRGIGTQ